MSLGCKEKRAEKGDLSARKPPASRLKGPNEIDFGSISNSVYRNAYFGLGVAIPEKWNIQDQEAQRKIRQMAVSTYAADNQHFQRVYESTEATAMPLFAVYKYPPLDTPPPNPSFAGVAESIWGSPRVKTASDYFSDLKKCTESLQLGYTFAKEYSQTIDGIVFEVLEAEITLTDGKKLKQNRYCTLLKGYALDLIISYDNAEDESLLNDMIKTVRFDKHPDN